jgi:hypothetical protein
VEALGGHVKIVEVLRQAGTNNEGEPLPEKLTRQTRWTDDFYDKDDEGLEKEHW